MLLFALQNQQASGLESTLKLFDLTPADGQAILIWTVLLAIFIEVLGRLLIAPLLEVIEAREAATKGASDTTSEILEKAKSVSTDTATIIATARKNAFEKSADTISKTKREASEKIAKAESEAAGTLQKKRVEIASELNEKLKSLPEKANELAALTLKTITKGAI